MTPEQRMAIRRAFLGREGVVTRGFRDLRLVPRLWRKHLADRLVELKDLAEAITEDRETS